MWHEIFKFEVKYRLKRKETYLFFLFLFAFSVFGVDFIFQGVELGLVKSNAPLVIGKAMGAITGIFMILTSMIMGMPMLRDYQYQITPLFYSSPIKKFDLLLGRFLGSFLILVIIFFSVPLGMMIGEFLPWHLASEMLSFRIASYSSSFLIVVLPILFFGSALFFVTGMLSKKLLVVYTQGIIFFVVFMLTKAIPNEYLQAVLDPFSLTTITQLSEDWTISDKNTLLMSFKGIMMVNKMFWMGLGILVMWIGYLRFNFSITKESRSARKSNVNVRVSDKIIVKDLPSSIPQYGLTASWIQFCGMSIFYTKSLLKEASFWAIVICGIIIILINSVNLGTVYGVDSFPTTYFIVAELQELSLYFFIIILLFYSGELYWTERGVGVNQICDAMSISSFVSLSSKMAALIAVYVVLILSLIVSGIVFQMAHGYYHFDLHVYFSGFFLEIFPFLVIYTFVAFFIQSVVHNKFLAILVTLIFFIAVLALSAFGFDHVLFNFGGNALESYSEMNGYGHFMEPYLWSKIYWILFGVLLLVLASLLSVRGLEVRLRHRLTSIRSKLTLRTKVLSIVVFLLFVLLGSYLFYQTHIMNEVWTTKQEQNFRANYEKTLKQFEYMPQVNIVSVNLHLELYPEVRSYDLEGSYTLKNEEAFPIKEIHVQKLIESDIILKDVSFSAPVAIDSQYHAFEYIIYQLDSPIEPGDSLEMYFTQSLKPKGYNTSGAIGSVLHNGTFIRNDQFPTLGYYRKYELREESERNLYGLEPRFLKAELDDIQQLKVSRTGSDSHGLRTDIVIGTAKDQIAVASGDLIRKWEQGNRNYFEYRTNEVIINFYAILSGRYEFLQEQWNPYMLTDQTPVALEIYYHPRHTYNLDRMMNGMRASLDYYSTNFSPYPYQQLRIVEFPRYHDFAQSFPSTIPFSESIGFMLEIDDIVDVDMTFFVTAHEVAHQWWGIQVEAANVKGRNFVLETLSQYSALMVFKDHFSPAKLDKMIELQQELYEKGRRKASVEEVPLYLVENQDYIYYNKGAIAMFDLYKLIGEAKINKALSLFIEDWNSRNGKLKMETVHYATSEDLIKYFLEVTPDGKRNTVVKLFKEI